MSSAQSSPAKVIDHKFFIKSLKLYSACVGCLPRCRAINSASFNLSYASETKFNPPKDWILSV